jgi:hypothetical protein
VNNRWLRFNNGLFFVILGIATIVAVIGLLMIGFMWFAYRGPDFKWAGDRNTYGFIYACFAAIILLIAHCKTSVPSASHTSRRIFWFFASVHFIALAVYALTCPPSEGSEAVRNSNVLLSGIAVLLAALSVTTLLITLTVRGQKLEAAPAP